MQNWQPIAPQDTKDWPKLKPNSVHVWKCKIDFDRPVIEIPLLPAELERTYRFKFEADQKRFSTARTTLRKLLGFYLDKDPLMIQFQQGEWGKPFVEDSEIEFNVSHSGDYVLLAFSLGIPVGIDVEKLRGGVAGGEIAKRYFSQNEVDQLLSLPKSEQKQAFFNCWSRKEAMIKAIGKGLSMSLQGFTVSIGSNVKPALLSADKPVWSPEKWDLSALNIDKNHAAALVTKQVANLNAYFFTMNV